MSLYQSYPISSMTLNQLPEVQILLIGHHVQALVEVIGVVAVERRREVAGDVERRAVAAQDQAGGMP